MTTYVILLPGDEGHLGGRDARAPRRACTPSTTASRAPSEERGHRSSGAPSSPTPARRGSSATGTTAAGRQRRALRRGRRAARPASTSSSPTTSTTWSQVCGILAAAGDAVEVRVRPEGVPVSRHLLLLPAPEAEWALLPPRSTRRACARTSSSTATCAAGGHRLVAAGPLDAVGAGRVDAARRRGRGARHRRAVHRVGRAGRRLLPRRDRRPGRPACASAREFAARGELIEFRDLVGRTDDHDHGTAGAPREALRRPHRLPARGLGGGDRGGAAGVLRRPPRLRALRRRARAPPAQRGAGRRRHGDDDRPAPTEPSASSPTGRSSSWPSRSAATTTSSCPTSTPPSRRPAAARRPTPSRSGRSMTIEGYEPRVTPRRGPRGDGARGVGAAGRPPPRAVPPPRPRRGRPRRMPSRRPRAAGRRDGAPDTPRGLAADRRPPAGARPAAGRGDGAAQGAAARRRRRPGRRQEARRWPTPATSSRTTCCAWCSCAATRPWRPRSASALALRLVVGVATADIARLFLVPEPTMAARLTRGKRKIVAAGIPFAVPDAVGPARAARRRRPGRLPRVHRRLRPRHRARTCCAPTSPGEAVRLVRVTLALRPDEPVLQALLALLLLQHSRRDARVGGAGAARAAPRPGPLALAPRRGRRGARAPRPDAGAAPPPRSPRATGCRRSWRPSTRRRRRHPTPGGTGSASTTRRWSRSTRHPAVRLAAAVALAERDGPRAGLDGARRPRRRAAAQPPAPGGARRAARPGRRARRRPSRRSTSRSRAAATTSSASTSARRRAELADRSRVGNTRTVEAAGVRRCLLSTWPVRWWAPAPPPGGGAGRRPPTGSSGHHQCTPVGVDDPLPGHEPQPAAREHRRRAPAARPAAAGSRRARASRTGRAAATRPSVTAPSTSPPERPGQPPAGQVSGSTPSPNPPSSSEAPMTATIAVRCQR